VIFFACHLVFGRNTRYILLFFPPNLVRDSTWVLASWRPPSRDHFLSASPFLFSLNRNFATHLARLISLGFFRTVDSNQALTLPLSPLLGRFLPCHQLRISLSSQRTAPLSFLQVPLSLKTISSCPSVPVTQFFCSLVVSTTLKKTAGFPRSDRNAELFHVTNDRSCPSFMTSAPDIGPPLSYDVRKVITNVCRVPFRDRCQPRGAPLDAFSFQNIGRLGVPVLCFED